jgi:hypothetical protein
MRWTGIGGVPAPGPRAGCDVCREGAAGAAALETAGALG